LYRLTDLGRPVAEEHSHHHDHTLEVYNQVLSNFSEDEQLVISSFLTRLLEDLR
jgi:transcriptional regulator, MarR family